MEKILKGLIISEGIFVGKARHLSLKAQQIPAAMITDKEVNAELQTLFQILKTAHHQLEEMLNALSERGAEREIFEAHQEILKDPELTDKLEKLITESHHNVAQAVKIAFEEAAAIFMAMDNDFFAQRAADYKDLQHRILSIILGGEADPLAAFSPGEVLFCTEPTPSLITGMVTKGIKAWVSEKGAYTSHAAILSRGLGLVAMSGIEDLPRQVTDGQSVILDAKGSSLIVEPDEASLAAYQAKTEALQKYRQRDLLAASQPAITQDGKKIRVLANIGLPQESPFLKAAGAEGIGLFRTEFLYLDQSSLPSEDQQYLYYRQVLEDMAPHPVTIRTFDLGGDKLSHLIPSQPEENPYLGCRGLRFSLSRVEIFKTQIKAVLRAAIHGDIRLMFPMVNDGRDMAAVRKVIIDCSEELSLNNVSHRAIIPLGVMIEIPSAALGAGELAHEADFFSIGTNDLAQYTLAADRNAHALKDIYIQHHPAVLKLIAITVKAAHKAKIPVAVCGEMASIPKYIPLLVAMGIDELSVLPQNIARCKEIIRRCDKELKTLVRARGLDDLATIEQLINRDLKKYYENGD